MYFKFDLRGYELNRLASLCRRGDFMACRAAQRYGLLQPGDLGYFGSIDLGGLPGEEECNEAALAAECKAGFPRSCEMSSDPWLQARAAKLAAEGCRVGLVKECPIEGTWEDFKWRCWVAPVMCFRFSPKVRDDYPYEPARRELAERACRLLGRDACIYLAAQYADGRFPQPVPGRARALAERFCTPAQLADPDDFCRNLSGETQEQLANLP